MARLERPLDPEAGPLQSFAHELRQLRTQAGSPTYAQLAKRTGYAASTLSQAAAGRQLPTWEVTEAYVTACGGTVDEWRRRWQALAPEKATPTPPRRYPLRFAAAAVSVVVLAALGVYLLNANDPEPAPQLRADFENGAGDWDPLWGDNVTVSIDTQTAVHGDAALSITLVGNSVTEGATGVGTDSGLAGLHAGTKVSCWVWSPGGVDGSVEPFARDEKYLPVMLDEHDLPREAGWFRVEWSVPAMDHVTAIGVQVNNDADGELTVLLDEVRW